MSAKCGTSCLEFAHDTANRIDSPMHGLDGSMAVSTAPPLFHVAEFPYQRFTCPHGLRIYIYPTPERITALRKMNQEPA